MAVFRVEKSRGYTVMSNHHLRNKELSLKAKGLLSQKDLIGIPWLLAFALRADGWYLRSDIIWQKENPMPESCKDRPSRCYEHIFLLAKSKQYFYDAAAIAEPIAPTTAARYRQGRAAGHKYAEEVPGQGKVQGINKARKGGYYDDALIPTMRNKRDIWLINTVPYKGGHFAAFPPKLAETCILAGCPKGGIVIDPFFGSGTTGKAAKDLDRHYIGIEITPDELETGETVKTPRGTFYVTTMSREQMEAAGYGLHHQSEDGKYLIMGNGTRAFAIPAEQPEKVNPLKHIEDTVEQNDNAFDGLINNTPQTPTAGELEQKAKAGEPISLADYAAAIKAEKERGGAKQEKPSIRAQLRAEKERAAQKKTVKAKNHELEV